VSDEAGSPATLRPRRTANLFGWAAAGALVCEAVWLVGGVVPVLGILALVLGPYVAGGVIGDHVERWPGWVAAAAAEAWSSWWLAGSSSSSEDRWAFVGLMFISLLISVTTARYRWHVRPKTLSGGPSR
jgi:hypothetical protein